MKRYYVAYTYKDTDGELITIERDVVWAKNRHEVEGNLDAQLGTEGCELDNVHLIEWD